MISQAINLKKVAQLYDGWTETCIISCLEGCMGKIYTDNPNDPESAVCILGDFAFYAGIPSEELVSYIPEDKQDNECLIMVGDSPKWEQIFKSVYGDRCELKVRHMIKKNPSFDRKHLEGLKDNLPEGYSIKEMDLKLADYCRNNGWTREFVNQFDDSEDFIRYGKGFMAIYDGEPVAGSSSYSYYSKGMEVEVITREDHRQKGLATACCAALILYCMDNGLNPSWDAANMNSVRLSAKLGYEYDYQYNSFIIHLN